MRKAKGAKPADRVVAIGVWRLLVLKKPKLQIMTQLMGAERTLTNAEMEGTTRTNKYARKMPLMMLLMKAAAPSHHSSLCALVFFLALSMLLRQVPLRTGVWRRTLWPCLWLRRWL